jgi:hypothetical protein
MSMTTEDLVKIIEALPAEKQQEVRDFAEFVARKDRRQLRRIRKEPSTYSRRTDAMFRAPSHSVEALAAQQGVQPISDTENLRGKNIWPEEDDIDEFVETIHRWRQEGTSTEDQP